MIGAVLGAYRLVRELGRGGMGAVFVGEHVTIGKQAAIKVLLPGRGAAADAQRFFNEARAAARIRHPGIVEVFDFGSVDDTSFLVMELLDGESLAARLQRGPVAVGLALAIARQV